MIYSDGNKLTLADAQGQADEDGKLTIQVEVYFLDLRVHTQYFHIIDEAVENSEWFLDWTFLRITDFSGSRDDTTITLEFELQLNEEYIK